MYNIPQVTELEFVKASLSAHVQLKADLEVSRYALCFDDQGVAVTHISTHTSARMKR